MSNVVSGVNFLTIFALVLLQLFRGCSGQLNGLLGISFRPRVTASPNAQPEFRFKMTFPTRGPPTEKNECIQKSFVPCATQKDQGFSTRTCGADAIMREATLTQEMTKMFTSNRNRCGENPMLMQLLAEPELNIGKIKSILGVSCGSFQNVKTCVLKAEDCLEAFKKEGVIMWITQQSYMCDDATLSNLLHYYHCIKKHPDIVATSNEQCQAFAERADFNLTTASEHMSNLTANECFSLQALVGCKAQRIFRTCTAKAAQYLVDAIEWQNARIGDGSCTFVKKAITLVDQYVKYVNPDTVVVTDYENIDPDDYFSDFGSKKDEATHKPKSWNELYQDDNSNTHQRSGRTQHRASLTTSLLFSTCAFAFLSATLTTQ